MDDSLSLVIPFVTVGLLVLTTTFCIALVGGLPWTKGFSHIKVRDEPISVLQISIGLMLLILGVLWLTTWSYVATTYRDVIFTQKDLAVHGLLQLPLSLVLLLSGVAALRNWKRWRGAYLISLALVAFDVAHAFGLELPQEPVFQLFHLVLPTMVLASMGISLFLYLISRVIRFEGE